MAGKKLSKSERIRAQIEVLRAAAVDAAKRERAQRMRTVTRAAARAGLDALALEADDLASEFSAIVARRRRATATATPVEVAGENTGDGDGNI